MDNKEAKKKADAMGNEGKEREKGVCIILKKGEVLSMDVFEDDLKKCVKKEKKGG